MKICAAIAFCTMIASGAAACASICDYQTRAESRLVASSVKDEMAKLGYREVTTAVNHLSYRVEDCTPNDPQINRSRCQISMFIASEQGRPLAQGLSFLGEVVLNYNEDGEISGIREMSESALDAQIKSVQSIPACTDSR